MLIRLVDMGLNWVFSDPHCMYSLYYSLIMLLYYFTIVGIHGLQMDLVLIRLVAMGLNWVFLDPHCMYSLYYFLIMLLFYFKIVVIYGLQMNLVLIRLVAMGLNWVFSDLHCRYTWPRGGSGFKHIGRHGFELGVLRS